MIKRITFSRRFPAYHKRAGEQTHFVEGILTQQNVDYTNHSYYEWLVDNNRDISHRFLYSFFESLSVNIAPKLHTIRSHKKPLSSGDYIEPHCWAGLPYRKTEEGFWQIKFCDKIKVEKVIVPENISSKVSWQEIAKNDGLSPIDFLIWFKSSTDNVIGQIMPPTSQIICFTNIDYQTR